MKVIFFIALIAVSCNTIKTVSNNTYKYKSKGRTLEISFDNGFECKLKNTFKCADLPSDVREIETVCNYVKSGDTIFLVNVKCKDSKCVKPLYMDIPTYEGTSCNFLSSSSKQRKTAIGPNYKTEYEKYGLVPNIDNDTIYVYKNKLILPKTDGRTSIGFIFK